MIYTIINRTNVALNTAKIFTARIERDASTYATFGATGRSMGGNEVQYGSVKGQHQHQQQQQQHRNGGRDGDDVDGGDVLACTSH